MQLVNKHIGALFLVRSKTWLPKRIQWFTDSIYNHAGVVVLFNDEICISEMTDKGCVVNPISDYHNKKYYSEYIFVEPKRLQLTEQQRLDISDYCIDNRGAFPYEYLNLLGEQAIRNASRKLLGKEWWIGKSEKRAGKKFICGEWAMWNWHRINGLYPKWYEGSPADILRKEDVIIVDRTIIW